MIFFASAVNDAVWMRGEFAGIARGSQTQQEAHMVPSSLNASVGAYQR